MVFLRFQNTLIISEFAQCLLTIWIVIDSHGRNRENKGYNTLFLLLELLVIMSKFILLKWIKKYHPSTKLTNIITFLSSCSCMIINIQILLQIENKDVFIYVLIFQKQIMFYLALKCYLQSYLIQSILLPLNLFILSFFYCIKFGTWEQNFNYYSNFLIIIMVVIALKKKEDPSSQNEHSFKSLPSQIPLVEIYEFLQFLISEPFIIFRDENEIEFFSKNLLSLFSENKKNIEDFFDSTKSPEGNFRQILQQSISKNDFDIDPTEIFKIFSSVIMQDCQIEESKIISSSKDKQPNYFPNQTENQGLDLFKSNSAVYTDGLEKLGSPRVDQIRFRSFAPSVDEDQQEIIQRNKIITQFKKQKFDIQILNIHILGSIMILVRINLKKQQFEDQELLTKIKELENMIRYKDSIMASVAHDFKTPLNGMTNIIQYLITSYENDSQINYYLELMNKHISLILFIMGDILDFSKLQKNQLKLCNSEFELKEVLQEVIDIIQVQATEKNIIFENKMIPSSIIMYSDPNRIKQIVMNLLSNSLKFTQQGSISLQVQIMSRSDVRKYQKNNLDFGFPPIENSQELINISIKDTGIGMPIEIISKLFQEFATFDQKGINKHGIGLGLVIVKRLVGMLGPLDQVDVKSTVDIGSEFSFVIYRNFAKNTQNPKQYANSLYISVKQSNVSLESVQKSLSASQILLFQKPSSLRISKIIEDQLPLQGSSIKSFDAYFQSDSVKSIRIIDSQSFQMEEDEQISKTKNIEQNIIIINPQSFLIQTVQTAEQQLKRKSNPQVDIFSIMDVNKLMKILIPPQSNILIVDDQPFNILAVKLQLKKFDWINTYTAFCGKQALNYIESDLKFRYILLDLQMPIMDGYTTVTEIRKYERKNVGEPNKIIAVTGFDDEKEKQICIDLGFDAFITKPLRVDSLIEVMKHLFTQ